MRNRDRESGSHTAVWVRVKKKCDDEKLFSDIIGQLEKSPKLTR